MTRRTPPPKSRRVVEQRYVLPVPASKPVESGLSSHLGGQFGFAPHPVRDRRRPGAVRL